MAKDKEALKNENKQAEPPHPSSGRQDKPPKTTTPPATLTPPVGGIGMPNPKFRKQDIEK
jgi:hypothetical protein